MTDDENDVNSGETPEEQSAPPAESEGDRTEEQNGEQPEEQSESSKSNESTISSDLIRGHINTIILRALYERDKYGYEIMNDIEQKSHGQYTLKQPTLYSALKRLENQGYIKAYWKTDEVSSGGRRKYFTLTESGKEITEKNLAEWEYSRTIIDSLISDRAFDFTQPAPTPVDFTILRDSVSRVPVVKSDEVGRENDKSEAVEKQTSATEEKSEQITAEQKPVQETYEQVTVEQKSVQDITPEERLIIEEQRIQEEEARRRAHENYLKLISTPAPDPVPVKEDIVPNSENVDADKLLYNNKPETERDYKNLINSIFNRTIANGSVQTTYRNSDQLYQHKRAEIPSQNTRISERGREDGVTVTSSANADRDSTFATRTTYNKGLALLKSSSIVLAIIAVEFIFSLIFLNKLNTTWVYPFIIIMIGVVQFAVFAILALKGYGKNSVIPTTHSYIGTCVILTIITILIISALSLLLNTNFTSASDIMKMLVIPSITALNITVFAVTFKLFSK